jgi:hypothetical protein
MIETRKVRLYTKAEEDRARHTAARAKRRAGALAAGGTVYREEFQRDVGPDLDEPLDVTESGREF